MKNRSDTRKRLLVISLIGFLVMSCPGCDRQEKQREKTKAVTIEQIKIAVPSSPPASPLFVAFKKGYFKEEGLDVTLLLQTSGKASLQAVIKGEADMAAVGEAPVMFAGLNDEKIYTIASYMSSTQNYVIVARKDRGIATPGDLSGKKIGVTPGTNSEFFMDALFMYNNINRQDVTVLNFKPPQMFEALMEGTVDAVSTWNPHVIKLQKGLADKQITFDGDGLYTGRFNLSAGQQFIAENPGVASKVLRALLRAVQTIHDNPDESLDTVSEYIKTDRAMVKDIWAIYDFEVTLSQSFIISLEDEARWAIRKGLTSRQDVPNYLDYIYMQALEEVKPGAVTIIR